MWQGVMVMMKKSTLISITGIFIFLSYIVSSFLIMQVPNVTVFSVTPQTVTSTVICTGKIEYSENHTVNSEKAGQIDKIYVSEGDCIKKGDKLYSINIGVVDAAMSNDISDVTSLSDEELIQSVLNGDISSLDDYAGDSIVVSNNSTLTNNTIDICSEYSGVVGEIEISSKNFVSPGDEILKIADSNSMQAKLDVSENNIGDIKVGQDAKITCAALKNSNMEGTVSKIGNVAKQTTTTTGKETTVEVIVKIDKGLTSAVKPGYTVKCTITIDSKDDAMILPYESIQYDDSGDEYVLCYSQTGLCEKRQVKTGDEYKDGVEVLSGITESELIISSPGGIAESTFAKATEEKND